MVTLKFMKVITPVCDVENANSLSSVRGKLTTLFALFFVKNKDSTKTKIGWFAFFKENIKHFKAFKNCQIIRPESLPLSKVQFPLRVTQNLSLVITITILILAFICLGVFTRRP